MSSTAYGATKIRESLQTTRRQVHQVATTASGVVNRLDTVISKLQLREKDEEPPKEDRIPTLAAEIAGAKVALNQLVAAIQLEDAAGYQNLAETPEPQPEPEPEPVPES